MPGRWRRSKRSMAQVDVHAHIPSLLPLTTSRKGISNAISCWYCDYKITSFNELIFQFGRRHARFLFQFPTPFLMFLFVEQSVIIIFYCLFSSIVIFFLLDSSDAELFAYLFYICVIHCRALRTWFSIGIGFSLAALAVVATVYADAFFLLFILYIVLKTILLSYAFFSIFQTTI